MHELQVKVGGDIGIRQFEQIDREDIRRQMKAYFHESIEILPNPAQSPLLPDEPLVGDVRGYVIGFSILGLLTILTPFAIMGIWAQLEWLVVSLAGVTAGVVTSLSLAGWLIGHFSSDKIWPGLMEERLSSTIARKFPDADADVRAVIDRYADLFLQSNWLLLRLKRTFQAGAIVFLNIAMFPISIFIIDGNILILAAIGLINILAILIVLLTFEGLNSHVYNDKYAQSLRISAQHVSNLIRDRMISISLLTQHTITHITQTQQRGESPGDGVDPNHLEDIELASYGTFFATQTLIWLTKRLEYIELYLLNRFHTLLTIESILNVGGLIIFVALLAMGVIPSLFIVFQSVLVIVPVFSAQTDNAFYAPIIAAATAVLTLVAVTYVSLRSYFNEKWNPLKVTSSDKSVLEQHFNSTDLGGWQTYVKQDLDVRLAARAQRASFVIRDYFNKLGRQD